MGFNSPSVSAALTLIVTGKDAVTLVGLFSAKFRASNKIAINKPNRNFFMKLLNSEKLRTALQSSRRKIALPAYWVFGGRCWTLDAIDEAGDENFHRQKW